MIRLLILIAVWIGLNAPGFSQPPSGIEFFEKKVRPILIEHCQACHSDEKKVKGGLRITSRKHLLEGGDSGSSLTPGEPNKSLLIQAIRYNNEALKMPPKGKLKPQEIADIEAWVKSGALWPEVKSDPIESKENGELFSPEQKQFWAFQPIQKPLIPKIHPSFNASHPIDAFILKELESKGLKPAPESDKRTWIRRVYYDLIGLPPTPEEIDEFLHDRSPMVYEKWIDRLLASPRYGERWGRHWLDLARYADSNGLDENTAFTNAYRYRDYIIRSLNQDKPYDRFIQEQIAGDLLTDAAMNPDCFTATGFLVIGPKLLAEPDKQKMKLDIADEQLDTIGKVFLGLTIGCARCHDHKFDPIPTRDYYGLLSIFTSTRTMQNLSTVAKAYERKLPGSQDMVLSVEDGATYPEVQSDGKPRNLFVQIRGNYLTPGEEAPPIFPRIIAGEKQEGFGEPSSHPSIELPQPNRIRYGSLRQRSGRKEFADWIASPKNPLTARVIVNRIWQHHFGEGIVRSPDNFGKLGDRPTHPELIDWLASELIEHHWSMKRLHKQILLSKTYRMSTTFDAASHQIDPENKLLWRFPRRRLEAEAIRDAMLFTSGNLNSTMGGSHLKGDPFAYIKSDEQNYLLPYRSIYLPVIRNHLYDFFQVFDFVEPSVANGKRASTVVTPQSLWLMNNSFVTLQAESLAQRTIQQTENQTDRIQILYQKLYSRLPRPDEIQRAIEWLNRLESYYQNRIPDASKRTLTVWKDYCQVLYASSEFIYLN